MSDIKKRKTFILDTSVLLYDCTSIHSFPGNDVVIPLVVLDELDRFKDKKGLIGENARYVNRYLVDLRQHGNLQKGIRLKNSDCEDQKRISTPSQTIKAGADYIVVGRPISSSKKPLNKIIEINSEIEKYKN